MNKKFKQFLAVLAAGVVSVGAAGALSACGGDNKTEQPAAHQHTYVEHVAVDADCENMGHEAYFSCSGCQKYFDMDKTEITRVVTTPALGHQKEVVERQDATATKDGMVEHYRCTRDGCGKEFKNQDDAQSTPHADLVIPAALIGTWEAVEVKVTKKTNNSEVVSEETVAPDEFNDEDKYASYLGNYLYRTFIQDVEVTLNGDGSATLGSNHAAGSWSRNGNAITVTGGSGTKYYTMGDGYLEVLQAPSSDGFTYWGVTRLEKVDNTEQGGETGGETETPETPIEDQETDDISSIALSDSFYADQYQAANTATEFIGDEAAMVAFYDKIAALNVDRLNWDASRPNAEKCEQVKCLLAGNPDDNGEYVELLQNRLGCATASFLISPDQKYLYSSNDSYSWVRSKEYQIENGENVIEYRLENTDFSNREVESLLRVKFTVSDNVVTFVHDYYYDADDTSVGFRTTVSYRGSVVKTSNKYQFEKFNINFTTDDPDEFAEFVESTYEQYQAAAPQLGLATPTWEDDASDEEIFKIKQKFVEQFFEIMQGSYSEGSFVIVAPEEGWLLAGDNENVAMTSFELVDGKYVMTGTRNFILKDGAIHIFEKLPMGGGSEGYPNVFGSADYVYTLENIVL